MSTENLGLQILARVHEHQYWDGNGIGIHERKFEPVFNAHFPKFTNISYYLTSTPLCELIPDPDALPRDPAVENFIDFLGHIKACVDGIFYIQHFQLSVDKILSMSDDEIKKIPNNFVDWFLDQIKHRLVDFDDLYPIEEYTNTIDALRNGLSHLRNKIENKTYVNS